MSAHPAFTMAVICVVGGLTGYVRSQSIPSLVAGTSVGVMYGWSGYQIRTGGDWGYEGALAASIVLLGSSAPRAAKGPIPLTLTIASSLAGLYYGKQVYDFRFAS